MVFAAVTQDAGWYMALEYASDEMKADKEVVLEEAKQNVGIAMKYASRNDNIGGLSLNH